MLGPYNFTSGPVRFVLAGLIALAVTAAASAGLFTSAEDSLTAARSAALSREPTGKTVIVEIDARSIARLQTWPWPRRFHADAVRQLSKAGVSTIAFDVDFSARSETGDSELAAAISQAPHVILPIFQQPASGNPDDQMIVSRPNAAFDKAWVGGVNIFPEPDGVVRTYPGATVVGGSIQPSIATLAAERGEIGTRSFQPDWSIEAGRIPRYSFVDVIEGKVPADSLHGKTVLIGATAIELGDRYVVPRYGIVPGVVIQALAVETLLQDRALFRTGPLTTLVGAILLAMILAPRRLDRPAGVAALYALALAAAAGGPFIAQAYWHSSIDSVAWLVTIGLCAILQAGGEAQRRLKVRMLFDSDTDLPNRLAFERALASAEQGSFSVVAGAIDRFESIRDGLGLAAAADLVRRTAELVGDATGAQVYRVAPDTLAWTIAGERSARSLDCRLESIFRAPVATRSGPADVNLTLGFEHGQNGLSPTRQIEHALAAISSARAAGQSSLWYQGANPRVSRELSMGSDLRRAMDEGRLTLVYQPKLALATGRIVDPEALVRWTDDDGRSISPAVFIPFAESTGFVREITRFALSTAARDLELWSRLGVDLRVSVNVSAHDLCAEGFAMQVARILDRNGVSTSQLTLEITESALIRSKDVAIASLRSLRDLGVRLSIDDYGTGQSSLAYLKEMPVEELKIDQSFVTNMCAREKDSIMVRSTIDLAHDLGLQVVAEGVESEEVLDRLKALGCDYVQGYGVSRPVDGPKLLKAIAASPDYRRVA